jgi:hypothetical protein
MSLRPQLVPAALLCAVAASLVLTGCGGSASTPPVSTTAKQEEQAVKFSKCLREHGLNVSTGTAGSGPSGAIKISGTNPQAFEAAQNACRRYRPSAEQENISPAEKAKRLEAGVKFARCMRSHGVNIPDPTSSGGGIRIKMQGGPGSAGRPDPSSPTFQAAQNACQGLLGKNLPKLSTSGGKASGGGGAGVQQVFAGPSGG